MNVQELVETYQGMTKASAEEKLNEYADQYKRHIAQLRALAASVADQCQSTFDQAFVLLCGVDGEFDEEEYAAYTKLIKKVGGEAKDFDTCQAYAEHLKHDKSVLNTIFSVVASLDNTISGFKDTMLNLAAALFKSNGSIEDEEIECLELMNNPEDESDDDDDFSDDISDSTSYDDVQIVAKGAYLTSNDGYSYLSVGATLKNPNKNKCARNVEVKILVKDSNNRILESNTDTIDYIDSNANFNYGAEIRIDRGSPANYSIQVYCDDFVSAPEDSTFASGITTSSYSVEKTRWGSTNFTGNVSNNYRKKLYVELYFTFFNGSKIVGGCSARCGQMYGNSEDNFDISLDAYSPETKSVRCSASFDFMELVD